MPVDRTLSSVSSLSLATLRPQPVRDIDSALKSKKADAPEQFEAFVMQSFIEEMLPKNAEGVFGSGLAGDYWKSMLAEQMGKQVASHGGIGIAHTIRGDEKPGVRNSLSSITPSAATSGTDTAMSNSVDFGDASGPPVILSSENAGD